MDDSVDQLASWLDDKCSKTYAFKGATHAWDNKIIERLVIGHYGDDYTRRSWDGELLNIQRNFRELKESHADI